MKKVLIIRFETVARYSPLSESLAGLILCYKNLNIKSKGYIYEPTYRMEPVGCETNLT